MSLKGLCRTCLCPTDNQSTILDVIESHSDSNCMSKPIVIMDLLKSFSQLYFTESEQLPERVCILCLTQITKIHSFIEKCEQNEKLLRQIASMKARVKVHTSNLRQDDEKMPPLRFRLPNISSSTKEKRRRKMIEASSDSSMSQSEDESLIKIEQNDEILPPTDPCKQEIKVEMEEYADNSIGEAAANAESASLTMPVYIKEEPELELDADVITLSSSESDTGTIKSEIFPVDYEDELETFYSYVEQSNARLWCARCEGQFNTKRSYDDHLSQCVHLLECDECLMTFQDQDELTAHSLNYHPHRDMSQSDNTLSDGEINTKDQSFPPRLTMKPQDSQETHLFSCPYCPKKFSSEQRLDSHIKCHNKSHYCAKCMKSFRSSHHLKAHNMRVHGASWKSIHCGVCQRYFACNADYVRHQLTHTKEKPYLCNMCPEKYRYKKFLENHMRQSHPNIGEEAMLEYLKEKYGSKTLPQLLDSTFTCFICRKVVERANLAEHVNSHKHD